MSNEELVLKYQEGDKNILESIIKANEKMVIKISNKFYTDKTNSIDKSDLIQEGYIGLMIACKKYRLDKENRATFISYAVYWIYRQIHMFIQRVQTNEEISIDIKDSEQLIDDNNYFVKIEDCIYYKEIRAELEELMEEELTLLERNIMKLYYGWDNEPMSFKELGEVHNLNPRIVKRINTKSLYTLRNTSWGKKEWLYRYQENNR